MVSSQVGFLKKVLILLGFSVTFVTKPDTARLLQDFSRDTSESNIQLLRGAHQTVCAALFLYNLIGT